jgi:hypothetical protein
LVTKVKPNINSVKVHPQVSNNRHPSSGWCAGGVLVHFGRRVMAKWLEYCQKQPSVAAEHYRHWMSSPLFIAFSRKLNPSFCIFFEKKSLRSDVFETMFYVFFFFFRNFWWNFCGNHPKEDVKKVTIDQSINHPL